MEPVPSGQGLGRKGEDSRVKTGSVCGLKRGDWVGGTLAHAAKSNGTRTAGARSQFPSSGIPEPLFGVGEQ